MFLNLTESKEGKQVNVTNEKIPVIRSKGEVLSLRDLTSWANAVNKMSGGRGDVFTEDIVLERLKGHHCSCGVNECGYSAGSFDLQPMYSEGVQTGGKAYMVCKNCGCASHL